jgi:tRNA (guanine-N7-)-methyltransferase
MAKKQLALEYYKAPPYDVILDPVSLRGRWSDAFGRRAPLHVEIGMGLGQYLVEFARRHPEMNHIGLEYKMHRIYTARHKALRTGVKHLRFVPGDANKALNAFAPGEVNRLTVLFSDPWSNEKFAHKRLTAPHMVAHFKTILAPGGTLHLRTDDPNFFAYTLETLREGGFALEVSVEIGRIKTGFEERWLAEGRQIYGLDAHPIG